MPTSSTKGLSFCHRGYQVSGFIILSRFQKSSLKGNIVYNINITEQGDAIADQNHGETENHRKRPVLQPQQASQNAGEWFLPFKSRWKQISAEIINPNRVKNQKCKKQQNLSEIQLKRRLLKTWEESIYSIRSNQKK